MYGISDLSYLLPDDEKLFECDIVFFATPHGVAMNNAGLFLEKNIKVIDLGADFRITDPDIWSDWYNMEHTQKSLLGEAVYGQPEIKRSAIKDARLIANLVPMSRGIEATIYADLIGSEANILAYYENAYENEEFVKILPEGVYPETRSVKSSNYCQISVQYVEHSNKLIIMSVIDNLGKGAAGQAIQNMNLMFGLDETEGLSEIGLLP
jgi:N-acetyl-gamma-glutamylphosphate reductase